MDSSELKLNEVLKQSFVFKSLRDDDIKKLETLFCKRQIQSGEILLQANETAQFFFLLAKGSVLISLPEDKALVLDNKGDFIGFELVSLKGVNKSTISVLEQGYVFAISRKNFLSFLQSDNSVAGLVMSLWQEYLEKTAPFVCIVKNDQELNFLDSF